MTAAAELGGLAGTRVLLLAAHPDDAEIALGGTIARLAEAGARVTVAVFTTSERADLAAQRQAAAERAAATLGHDLRWVRGGRDHQVEDVPGYRLVSIVDQLAEKLRPDVVISHAAEDSHGDHRRLAAAVLASSRRWPATLYACRPVEFRTPALLDFTPNLFVDIGPAHERKLAAIGQFAYPGQGFRVLDLDAVARIDAFFGTLAGCAYAEPLRLVRQHGLPVELAFGAARPAGRPGGTGTEGGATRDR